jgi:hypothetical protein
MRTVVSLAISMLVPAVTFAAPVEKLYYLGEVKLSSPSGASMGSQVIMLEKTQDRDNSVIAEKALVIRADGKVEEFTARLAVKEDGTFTYSDDAKLAEGTGALFGPAWKWTYFKGTFKAKNGIVIEDENFMADDSVGTARKKLIGPDNKVFMYMDMSLKSITPKTYEILRASLMKK